MYKVALIDDDEWILKGIEYTFPWAKYGFTVDSIFTDTSELLNYLKTNTVDVIFTDIQMPNMTGLELIETIRNNLMLYDILFVIISAYDDYDFMRKAINLGVADYCLKPIQREATDKILKSLSERLAKQPKAEGTMLIPHKGFAEIIDYINHNFASRLTLKEISDEFSYNANYVCLLFRNNLNMSFSKYLITVRMEKAKQLFDTGKYSVKEVQMMVGYSEYSYFHSVFTKYFGITPAKYLKGDLSKDDGEA